VLEERALTGIREKLVSGEAVQAAALAYAKHVNEMNRERRIQAEADVRALEKIERGIAGILAAIEDGMYQPVMKARMAELERQKAEILARRADVAPDVPDIHPGVADAYRRKVDRLIETLDDPDSRMEALADIRSLIGKIVVLPSEKRGEVHATLHGEVINILDFARGVQQPGVTRVTTKVASGSLE
jgi:DNA-directed RNA polymerase subunit L